MYRETEKVRKEEQEKAAQAIAKVEEEKAKTEEAFVKAQQEKLQMAKSMLPAGISVEQVSQLSGFSVEELKI